MAVVTTDAQGGYQFEVDATAVAGFVTLRVPDQWLVNALGDKWCSLIGAWAFAEGPKSDHYIALVFATPHGETLQPLTYPPVVVSVMSEPTLTDTPGGPTAEPSVTETFGATPTATYTDRPSATLTVTPSAAVIRVQAEEQLPEGGLGQVEGAQAFVLVQKTRVAECTTGACGGCTLTLPVHVWLGLRLKSGSRHWIAQVIPEGGAVGWAQVDPWAANVYLSGDIAAPFIGILAEEPSATPSPTATREPTRTPTATPERTNTPMATPTAQPSITPLPWVHFGTTAALLQSQGEVRVLWGRCSGQYGADGRLRTIWCIVED